MKDTIKFYLITLFISWSIWCGAIFSKNKQLIPLLHILGSLGPMIAAWINLQFTIPGSKDLKFKLNFKNLIWVLLPIFIYLVSALYLNIFQNKPFNFSLVGTNDEFFEYPKWIYWFFCIFFFGFGEEFGWRRSLTPYLEKRFGFKKSIFVFVILWAIWHIPLFWITPGYKAMNLPSVLGWIFSLWAGAVLLQRIHHLTGSIMAVAIFHGLMDIFFNSKSPDGVMMVMGGLISIIGLMFFILPLKNFPQK